MGLRFRKSKKVGPFRVNISQKGVGWSVGVPGLRYTKKAGGGSRVTASVPGTGISYVKESGGSNQRKKPRIAEGNTAKLNAAKPSASRMPVPSPELTEPQPPQNGGKKTGHGCLWWVMAIFFWPFFLSAWFWKTDKFKLKKPARAFALVAVWAILLASWSASSTESNLAVSSSAASSVVSSSAPALEAESEPESLAASSEPAEDVADSQPEEAASAPMQEEAPSESTPASEAPAAAAPSEPAQDATAPDSTASGSPAVVPAPVPVPTPAPAESSSVEETIEEPEPQEAMVWVTATGSKYHSRPNCGNTKSSSQVPISRAIAMGLEPCKRCY
ncbi:MAG TPA: DUF4236 domain-containing protein [Candidatus Faecalibacterium intestinigallinarum]|uniref:DUF4236 domain-containing protein n=1 Tax=Candidatus Faecalibacterium intestinigallinarum TaxID=2838581 RepID=A0A9D1QA49_9FIRM|nr:DUF4236 domain-containing protein [Candidatus Faecalibacterium intestinigallinarum]